MYRSATAAAGLTLALTVGAFAGCGGGGHSNNGVASLAGAGGTTTTVAAGKGNVAQLYHQWAECMRQHGVQMADPTINADGTVSVNITGGVNVGTGDMKSIMQPCQALHDAAQRAANGGKPAEKPDPAKLLRFSRCMRAHGVSDFPDPSGNGLRLSGGPNSDLNPDNPTFQAAQKACQSIIGAPKGGERIQARAGGPGGPGGPGPDSGSGGQSGAATAGG